MSHDPADTLLGEEPFRFGDAVTHTERGLAELVSLDPSPAGDGELIRLRFRDDEDVLFPVTEADHLFEYGAPAGYVTLDKADGDWEGVKAETEALLAETARAVVDANEQRRATKAPVIAPNDALEKVAAAFPHEPTADQEAALAAILTDLGAGSPMDRVLVADTGFGKTEVALRAAAVVIAAGYQVAVAAPTTVLCRQHAETFADRLRPIGARVVRLSGLETDSAHDVALAAMASGEADLVVGTHALASDGVKFSKLGLLITDEEQRFGSEQKEVLRALGRGCHVLNLTATPIPRTLAAAEAGLRDLSLIRTPPAARLAVDTQRTEDFGAVVAALKAEHERGGQSFVVCPRIAGIEGMRTKLEDALSGITIDIAHGDLGHRDVEAAMGAFVGGKTDILISTAIIETGIDLPNANTMIITEPDRFGLAQLHQLRGRVGRADRQASLLLFTEGDLSDEAGHRLDTLVRLSDVGAGFAVAARDLGQRGSGELFGEEQTGHLNRLGLGLARDLMAKALADARGEPVPKRAPAIGACDGGAIPADYIEDPLERLRYYVRIGRAASRHTAAEVRADMEEAHGKVPPPVITLLRGAYLRALCRRAGVTDLDAGPGGVAVTFDERRREQEATATRVDAARDRFGDPKWSKGRLVWASWYGEDEDPCDQAHDLLAVLADEG